MLITASSKMTPADSWIVTEATVTSCRFQFARMNTWTLGIQTQDKFRITFDYYAHGKLYSDEFQSPVAIPQDTPVPVRYNPLAPEQNDRTSGPSQRPSGASSRKPQLIVGVVGSIVLSLLWLTFLHGCR
jgi:hypothetical protein